jgi:hypothetical protein
VKSQEFQKADYSVLNLLKFPKDEDERENLRAGESSTSIHKAASAPAVTFMKLIFN